MIDKFIWGLFAFWTLIVWVNFYRKRKILLGGGSLMEKECVALIASKWMLWLNSITLLIFAVLDLNPKHLIWIGPFIYLTMIWIAARIWVNQQQ